MKSSIFYSKRYTSIERKVKQFLNDYTYKNQFLSKETIKSPRATGDAIQYILENNFKNILGNLVKDYSADFARRAMADIAFTDKDDLYYVVDVKTHRLGTNFNMPNLISVERLSRFYENDKHYFTLLIVVYDVSPDSHINVKKVYFVPIEFLSWECLTIGALGWGQIQIANASNIKVNHAYSRKKWMLELCNTLFEFYPREIEKVKYRMDYFKKVQQVWENKKDIWT